ncbi:MAG: hypothetical protein QM635_05955 [Microbacteriaceae bacterium]
MKNVLVFVLGVAAGFAAAHYVAKTERGGRILDEVDARLSELADAVVDGYRAREAGLKAAVAEAQDVIGDAADRIK